MAKTLAEVIITSTSVWGVFPDDTRGAATGRLRAGARPGGRRRSGRDPLPESSALGLAGPHDPDRRDGERVRRRDRPRAADRDRLLRGRRQGAAGCRRAWLSSAGGWPWSPARPGGSATPWHRNWRCTEPRRSSAIATGAVSPSARETS